MRTTRQLRLQAAVDYLVTYGWAIIVISISLAFIYFYLQGQVLSLPSRCSLGTEVICTDLALGSNTATATTAMQIVLVNGQQYSVENAIATVNISGYGDYSPICSPFYVLPGGKVICSVTGLPSMHINSGASGYILFNESVCTTIGTTSCSKYFRESFNGTYGTTVSPSVPSVSCTMTANALQPTATAGTSITMDANVLLSGSPVQGITVGFVSSSSHSSFSQNYALSNPNGTASVSVTDPQAESVTITVNSLTGCTATNTITFT